MEEGQLISEGNRDAETERKVGEGKDSKRMTEGGGRRRRVAIMVIETKRDVSSCCEVLLNIDYKNFDNLWFFKIVIWKDLDDLCFVEKFDDV